MNLNPRPAARLLTPTIIVSHTHMMNDHRDQRRMTDKAKNGLTFHVSFIYVGRRMSTGDPKKNHQDRSKDGAHGNPFMHSLVLNDLFAG